MTKFMVVVFDDEVKASAGVAALKQLHGDGSITLYGFTVLQRKPDGTLSVKGGADEGPVGLGVGTLLGALVGVLGGPVGLAIGATAGAATGAVGDIVHGEVSDEFLDLVQKDLTPGKFAVVAELSEEWVAPVDVRMSELGGRVVRETREDFVSGQIEKRTEARRKERDQMRQERAGAKADKSAKELDREVAEAEKKLQKVADKARSRLEATREELASKMHALEEQAASASPEVQKRIGQRIAEMRADFGKREEMLARAFELAEKAIHA